MNVGILGSGDVAKALGQGFLSRGHAVMLGTRDPGKLADWQKEHAAKSGSFEETAKFGEMLVLATLGTAALAAIDLAGVSNFDGKIVVDATNPLRQGEGGPQLSIGFDDSLG